MIKEKAKSVKQKPIITSRGLPQVVSPHIQKLIQETGGSSGPIGKQFIEPPIFLAEEKLKRTLQNPQSSKAGSVDPFQESAHEVAPGLVYRYRGNKNRSGRALWTISRYCASYCRFCFRGRVVGLPATQSYPDGSALGKSGYLSGQQLEEVFTFIKTHRYLREIILSGGDPLLAPKPYLTQILENLTRLQQEGHIDIIRIGTRLPIQSPDLIKPWHYQLISRVKNPYIMLHVNHPAELTPQTLAILYRFRQECMATIMSQTVLLKGINDSVATLQNLFETLAKEGIRPYYLFQNDPIPWAERFTVPFPRALKIWSQLRPRLSGLAATVKFTVESQGSYGKIPVPETAFWNTDTTRYKDFSGKTFLTS